MRRPIIRFASHNGGRTQTSAFKTQINGVVMRNSLILFSFAALVGACSEQDQQPTSPATTGSATRASSSPVVSSTSQVISPQAKPTDQVGFTTIDYLTGVTLKVAAGDNGQAFAMCPVGTQATGGGYRLLSGSSAAMPTIGRSMVYFDGPQSGWTVVLRNVATGATEAEFGATVVCVH